MTTPPKTSSAEMATAAEFQSGVEVVTMDKQNQPAFAIKIDCFVLFKSLLKWIKEYEVLKTVRQWSAQVDWRGQVWRPLKSWIQETDWTQVRRQVKEGLNEVDWSEVREEVKKGLSEVDWKEVRKEVKEGMQEVDWKKTRREVSESLQELNWKEIREEVNEAVNWKEVKKAVEQDLVPDHSKDEKGEIAWKKVRDDLVSLCPEGNAQLKDKDSEDKHDNDWVQVRRDIQEVCPEVEEAFESVAAAFSSERGSEEE